MGLFEKKPSFDPRYGTKDYPCETPQGPAIMPSDEPFEFDFKPPIVQKKETDNVEFHFDSSWDAESKEGLVVIDNNKEEEQNMANSTSDKQVRCDRQIVKRYHFWYYGTNGEKIYSSKEYESAARQASQDGYVVEKYHWADTGSELRPEEIDLFLP